MQVVCEATQNSSSAVQVAAFECLVAIMAYYYHYMGFYMEQALFGVSGRGNLVLGNVLTLLEVDGSGNEASRQQCRHASRRVLVDGLR